MIADRIREDMSVISADDRCVGFTKRLEDDATLRITSIAAGYGFDRLIPLAWVGQVERFVYLDKTSAFVAANWKRPAPARAKARRTNSKFEGRTKTAPDQRVEPWHARSSVLMRGSNDGIDRHMSRDGE